MCMNELRASRNLKTSRNGGASEGRARAPRRGARRRRPAPADPGAGEPRYRHAEKGIEDRERGPAEESHREVARRDFFLDRRKNDAEHAASIDHVEGIADGQ